MNNLSLSINFITPGKYSPMITINFTLTYLYLSFCHNLHVLPILKILLTILNISQQTERVWARAGPAV